MIILISFEQTSRYISHILLLKIFTSNARTCYRWYASHLYTNEVKKKKWLDILTKEQQWQVFLSYLSQSLKVNSSAEINIKDWESTQKISLLFFFSVVFDPSVLYGHCQFDLILSYLEEAFDEQFFQEYHKIIPKSSRCNDFLLVYEFFYHAVMWYHIDDVKYQCSTHSSADRVKDMLQKQYITTWSLSFGAAKVTERASCLMK